MTLLQTGGAALPPTSPGDSILVVQTPQGFRLPAGPSSLTRALFDRPQELQWAALSLGVLLFAAVAFLVLRYRVELGRWLTTRSRAVTVGLAGAALVATAAFAAVGWQGFQMTEHDNAFCTSCHLMHQPIARFYQTKHRRVECHDCHKQSMFASLKELRLWVFERPTAVEPHDNLVANEICEGCHLKGGRAEGIAANDRRLSAARKIDGTPGHAVHLGSARQPGMQCVQCHARPTPHVFRASNATCQQAGCHDAIRVKLTKMQGLDLQCTACHDFLRPAPSVKAAFGGRQRTLLPARAQCESCHRMKQRLQQQHFAGDPHREQCGLCHNPHRQADAAAAVGSCANGGCHTNVAAASTFHVGLPPKALAHCSGCHQPHTWKARSKVCTDCHAGGPPTTLSAGPFVPGPSPGQP